MKSLSSSKFECADISDSDFKSFKNSLDNHTECATMKSVWNHCFYEAQSGYNTNLNFISKSGDLVSGHQAVILPRSSYLKFLVESSECCGCVEDVPTLFLPDWDNKSIQDLVQLLYCGSVFVTDSAMEELLKLMQELRFDIARDKLIAEPVVHMPSNFNSNSTPGNSSEEKQIKCDTSNGSCGKLTPISIYDIESLLDRSQGVKKESSIESDDSEESQEVKKESSIESEDSEESIFAKNDSFDKDEDHLSLPNSIGRSNSNASDTLRMALNDIESPYSDISQKLSSNTREIKESVIKKKKSTCNAPDTLQFVSNDIESPFSDISQKLSSNTWKIKETENVSQIENEANGKRKWIETENLISSDDRENKLPKLEIENMKHLITYVAKYSTTRNFEDCSDEVLDLLAFGLGTGLHKTLAEETKAYKDLDKGNMKDDVVFNLSNKKVAPILSFFEGITNRDVCDGDNIKIKKLACNFYETAQKATNQTIIPPQAYGASESLASKAGYEALRHTNETFGGLGGCRQTHVNNLNTDPIKPSQDGALVIDNLQKGIRDMQHYDGIKLDRKTPCQVFTNVVKVILPEELSQNVSVFNKVENIPCQFEVHPLFAPAGDEFVEVMVNRLNRDLVHGYDAQKSIVENLLRELQDEINKNGESSIEKHLKDINNKCPRQYFYCRNCGSAHLYNPNKDNECKCGYNGSYYHNEEAGPYMKYDIPHGPQREAKVLIQEPQNIAPNSIHNLSLLYEKFPDSYPKEYLSYLLGADAVPAILYGRMMHDHVYCTTHKKLIKLSNQDELIIHFHPDCFLQWPFPNLHRIVGDSHEEIFMNLLGLAQGIPFGLLDFIEALGKKSKNAQLQAVRTRQLHDLYAYNFQWTMGNLKALGLPYIKSLEKGEKPTRDGFFTFANGSKDFKYIARFNTIMKINLPPVIKRMGNRLNNINVSNGASAMGALVAMTFSSTYYRDHYYFKYANGEKHKSQENLEPLAPRRLEDFLSEDKKETLKASAGGPGYANYQPRIPTIASDLLEVINNHRIISTSNRPGTSEGLDFKQEKSVKDIVKKLPKQTILTFPVLQSAARKASREQIENPKSSSRGGKRYNKYDNEIDYCAAYVLSKKEDPRFENGLGELNKDVLYLRKIGFSNFREFVTGRLKGIPCSAIKLRPAHITLKKKEAFDHISSKTIEEIKRMIRSLLDEFEDCDGVEEIKRKVNSKTTRKPDLVNIYTTLEDQHKAMKLIDGKSD